MTRLIGLLLLAATSAGAQRPAPVVVSSAAALAPALAGTRRVWLRVTAAELSPQQAEQLRAWVTDGGALWTETDAAGLFGFQVDAPARADFYGHGRRACPRGATALMVDVDDVYFHLAPNAALLVSHPSALPLLRVIDGPRPPTQPRYISAALYYGRGQVIHRPAEVHPTRADGRTFETNLNLYTGGADDEVLVPLETLPVAYDRAKEAARLVKREPDKAKPILYQVFLAYRLWYAEHLTATGKLEEALAQLSAVAADLPEDPAVYLAVARLNDKLGRTQPAAEARARAKEIYDKLRRQPPAPDAPQLRVPWPVFVGAINAAGAAWENPLPDKVAEVEARTAHLLGLDAYRRHDLDAAQALWDAATRAAANWPLPWFQLGLLHHSRGEDIRQANRTRMAAFTLAGQCFLRAAGAPPTEDFTAESAKNAADWAAAAAALATGLQREPPDAEVRGHFVLRYDGADRRLQVGPLKASLLQALEQAYAATAQWGVYLDDTEVLVYPDALTMRQFLPAEGVTPQAYTNAATVGRRVYTVASSTDIGRLMRHELSHVATNALTEHGLPAPLWVDDGLATAVEQHPTRSQMARINLRRGQYLSIAQLNDATVYYDRAVVDQAFGQSALMVQAFVARWGAEALVDFLKSCGWGEAPATAFQRLTGMSQEQFLAALVQGRFGN